MTDRHSRSENLWKGPAKATGECGFRPNEVHTGGRKLGRFTDRAGLALQRVKPRFGVNSLRGLSALLLASIAAPLAAQAPGEESAVFVETCDRDCLIGQVRTHMAALAARDPSIANYADDVVFTENNVPIKIGAGLWGTVTAVDEVGMEAADPRTGNAAWFGSVREHGEPAIYAVRIHVNDAGEIDEIETVVHRRTALPAPFGDVENMVHDPEFNEILPPEQRRSRERLLASADTYFDTVERNDGQVFAHFTEDCARLENGISTTAPAPGASGAGNAAAIASGCREQFELGIYYINKRIRRDHFIVDEERGVVVSRGFFDHDNEVDRYLLTNGREMRTALKWPNSISLIEAFRIKDGAIQRIEAVFTYVPYFMNNPFWGPDAAPPSHRPDPAGCDAACLTAQASDAIAAMAGNKGQQVKWADKVAYAENSVGIRVGEGTWATATATDPNPLIVADAQTGKAVWVGRIEEHGQPAWAAMTVTGTPGGAGGIDAVIRRKEYAGPYAEPNGAPQYDELPQARRTVREAMEQGAEQVYAAMNAQASAPQVFTGDCRWFVNGQDVADCVSPFGGPALSAIGEVRDREVLAVDEARGLIVYRTFEDLPATSSGYPLTYQVVELFRFDRGRIAEIQAWTSELPYGMKPFDRN